MANEREIYTSGTQNTSGSGTQTGSSVMPSGPSQTPLTTPQVDPSPSPSEQVSTKRKATRAPSDVWNHFRRDEKDKNMAICNYCKKVYAAHPTLHGTSNLKKHLKVCKTNPSRELDNRQKTIILDKDNENNSNSTVTMKLAEFNQDKTRLALAKMIVVDELAFKFVENEGFREFMSEAQPRFKIPSRTTIARDCLQLFIQEKDKLRNILSSNRQMVSLTTDTWTSIQNLNYMCVTAHYIDEDWKLNKKILSFALISDYKGETIGKSLEKCLKDWGILRICCVTVDNASSNSLAITHLTNCMSDWDGVTLLNGEYMHMRCCAHILNLIVNEGLKVMDDSVMKIRAACKYVKSSPQRLAIFKKCVVEVNIESKAMLTLDVPTRWNSTYMMLDVAEKFQKAFTRLERYDKQYGTACATVGGAPGENDWKRARVFVKLLKVFYDTTLQFSGSLFVTSNTFFRELTAIHKTIIKWMHNDDMVLAKMATDMKVKFDKYWDCNVSINYLLFVAVFLDPRYKLELVDVCSARMYGEDMCKEMMVRVKDLISKLFEQYSNMNSSTLSSNATNSLNVPSSGSGTSRLQVNDANDSDDDLENEFRSRIRRKHNEGNKSELDRYMEDDHVDERTEDFDILKWWKGKRMKYINLSCMARDILAIPVSTVSSESVFSTGGRVLDPFRSSLLPTTIEALVCTQNWLRNPLKQIDLRDTLDDVEHIETGLDVFTSESLAANILEV